MHTALILFEMKIRDKFLSLWMVIRSYGYQTARHLWCPHCLIFKVLVRLHIIFTSENLECSRQYIIVVWVWKTLSENGAIHLKVHRTLYVRKQWGLGIILKVCVIDVEEFLFHEPNIDRSCHIIDILCSPRNWQESLQCIVWKLNLY